ncbi:MAG: hypothetical protein U9N46_00465 [Euryarchaeota archaeon]|nr:hypothetical protein [Euryarchaeota archaeon]
MHDPESARGCDAAVSIDISDGERCSITRGGTAGCELECDVKCGIAKCKHDCGVCGSDLVVAVERLRSA